MGDRGKRRSAEASCGLLVLFGLAAVVLSIALLVGLLLT